MRITCPGCGSAYEVPERAVPDPGRDVQCAGCGASWFLLKGGAAGPDPAGRGRAAGAGSGPSGGLGTGPGVRDPAMAADAGAAPEPAARHAEDLPPARRVDPDVAKILREEAATERRARAAATGTAAPQGAGTGASAAPAQAPHPTGDEGALDPSGAAGMAIRQAPGPTSPRAGGAGAADLSDARGRLARLTEAERQWGGSARGNGTAWDGGADRTDHGLVEDPDPARHGPRPPLMKSLPPQTATAAPPVPTLRGSPDHGALVALAQRRRGFRLGFAATAGLCCAALSVYLLALRAGDGLDTPVVDAVRHHGGQVQAALVDWLRRVVVPALS